MTPEQAIRYHRFLAKGDAVKNVPAVAEALALREQVMEELSKAVPAHSTENVRTHVRVAKMLDLFVWAVAARHLEAATADPMEAIAQAEFMKSVVAERLESLKECL